MKRMGCRQGRHARPARSSRARGLHPSHWIAVVWLAAVLAGCVSEYSARLTGPSPAGGGSVILSGTSRRSGTATAKLGTGEQCTGTFNTVADHITWDDERPYWPVSEDSQVGVLFLSCPSGYVLRCNYAHESEGSGYGQCNDARGRTYALLF